MTSRPSSRPDDAGQERGERGRGQDEGQRDDDEALEREPDERVGREPARLVGSDERDPHDEQREQRERDATPARTRPRAGPPPEAAIPARSRLRRDPCGAAAAPQPPHVAAERLGQQGERGGEGDARQRPRQDVRRRDRQHDALRRRDGLAPVAPRQRRAHPRERPPGREERVARRADREHPDAGRGGDVHAEGEDQERVDLAVQLRAERRRRPGAPGDLSVDPVERERDGRERHERRDRRRAGRTSPRSAPRRRRRASPGPASPSRPGPAVVARW